MSKTTQMFTKELDVYKHTDSFNIMVRFLQYRLDTLRIANDSAPADEVTLNQGAIKEVKHLLRLLT